MNQLKKGLEATTSATIDQTKVSGFLAARQKDVADAQKNYNDMVGFGTDAQVAAAKADLDRAKKNLDLAQTFAKTANGQDTLTVAQEKYNAATGKTITAANKVSKSWNLQASSMLLGGKAANDYSNILIDLNKQIFENTTLTGAQAKATANIPKAINVAAAASTGTIKKMGAAANVTADQINQFQVNADNAAKAVEALKQATQDAASGFSAMAQGAKDALGKGFDKLNMKKSFDRVQKEANDFNANFFKAMDKGGFEGGKAFALKFAETPQKFIKPKDVIAFDSLIKWINANAGLPAEAFSKQLAIKWAQLAPETQTAFGKLMAGLPEEATTIGTETGTAMGTATVAAFRKATDKKLFPQAGTMLGPLVGDKGGFPKTPIIPKGPTTPAITTQKTIITADNSQAIKAVDVVAKRIMSLTKINPQIPINNQPAIKAIDAVAKRIDSLSKINPQIPVNNKPAIKAVDAIAKRIDGLSKINPDIKVNNKPALKAIDVIAKRITSLPTGDVTVKVHYDTSGKPAGIKAQSGFHGTLIEDTTILAHKGERVDIGRADSSGTTRSSGSGGGGGSGGGDLIVNNVIDIGGDRFVRSFKRKLGTDRYTFGS